jgi:hypothetical protein
MDVKALGLGGSSFWNYFRNVENHLGDYPKEGSMEVPESEYRIQPTATRWPDLPALYVYFRVEENPNKIVFVRLSPAWTQADLYWFPEDQPPDED